MPLYNTVEHDPITITRAYSENEHTVWNYSIPSTETGDVGLTLTIENFEVEPNFDRVHIKTNDRTITSLQIDSAYVIKKAWTPDCACPLPCRFTVHPGETFIAVELMADAFIEWNGITFTFATEENAPNNNFTSWPCDPVEASSVASLSDNYWKYWT